MAQSLHLTREGELFGDPKRYRRLVGKLNYFTVTRLDIAHSVSVVAPLWHKAYILLEKANCLGTLRDIED